MSLSSGTRFGSYEIVEPIGAGGMGEVYRARDTTLGRDVALKVLPASFSNDAMRVARFEKEAKTLASLNQANIAHISGHVVSMLGDDSEWVKNIRAADGEAFIKRGRSRPVVLKEIPAEKRAPILKAWSQIATSGRQHLPVPHSAPVSAFEAIAADHPVFRIDPV